MKKFNLEQAKAGKPVCTRSGQPARIVCFDREHSYNFSIVALVKEADGESVLTFDNEGHYTHGDPSDMDLMMANEKHIGWVNIYGSGNGRSTGGVIYESKYNAEINKYNSTAITAKIVWED